jgi:outer membrane receptor protein involved in Fe transport
MMTSLVLLRARCLAGAFLLLSSFMPSAVAQAAAASQPKEPADTLVLSPFEVSSERDTGYRATKSMTSTGISMDIAKTPLNIQVITGTFLEDLNLDSMHQAIRYVSGVQNDEFNRDASGVRIRGMQVGTFYRNGIPRPSNVTTDNVDRIEVVKGPVATFFGQGNPGGIINYITKKPEFVNEGSLKLTVGSYDYKKAVLDVQGVLPAYEKLGARLIVARNDSEDWRSYEYLDSWYVAPSLRWRPNDKLDVRLDYEWTESNENLLNNGRTNLQFHEDWASPPADVIDQFRNASRPTDAAVIAFLQNRWNRSIGNWATDVAATRGVRPPTVTTGDLSAFYPEGRTYNTGGPGGEKFFKTKVFDAAVLFTPVRWLNARYTYSYRESFTDRYQPFAFPNGDRTIPFAERTNINWQYDEVNRLDLLLTKQTGPIDHRLLVGGELSQRENKTGTRRMDYSSLQPVQSRTGATLTGRDVALFYDPFLHPVIDVQNLIKEVNPNVNRNFGETEAIYASHQASMFDDRLNTLIGVRREENDDGTSGTTPNFGATYQFAPGFSVFANYSENFRINGPNVSGPGVLPGERIDNLPPETAKGTDIGIKSNWRDDTLSGTLTYFKLENTNIRRNDTQRTFFTEPRNQDSIQTNNVTWFSIGGREASEGFEADLIWVPSRNFELLAAYSWVWEAKIVADPSLTPGTQDYDIQIGRRLTNTPEHQFKLWGKYNFSQGRLKGFSIGAGGRYVGPTKGATHQSLFDINMPSYTVVDLSVGYAGQLFGRRVTAAVMVENATDHIYLQGQNNIFADPRKIYLNLGMRF